MLFQHCTLNQIKAASVAVAYAGLMSVGIAFTLLVVCQKHCSSAPAASIMSLEAVFAAIAGFLIRFLAVPTERIPQGKISLHLEEMKLPLMGDDLTLKSATVVPMLSSSWQAKQDSNNKELQGQDDRFRYDGKFVANPKVLGVWAAAAMVPEIDHFDPAKPLDADLALLKTITLKDGGLTDSTAMLWSGDTLMDLNFYQAMKMTPRTIGGTDYLFIEAGGFSTTPPPGWESPLVGMKRQ